MSNLPAILTAVTALVTAVAGLLAVVRHQTGPAHKPPQAPGSIPPRPGSGGDLHP